ncbi:Aspartic peptidase A1 family protein [Dioscorea alata]|uniref:Aspartic peptidase A1 family protein n=1 Tax=Dioscorea alata TaxID=55571 RepID=A0ACB7ULD6_DIOAL|nr:Aspartic peptidase A1 family protein [Dioscorea alata]
MRPLAVKLPLCWAVTLLLILTPLSAMVDSGTVLKLDRLLPGGMGLEALRARDRARHARLLLGSSPPAAASVVDFPVEGSGDPYTIGLYFTRIKLGNPPKEFYVQIDTGSDILWVTCEACNGCPTRSGLNIPLEFFDPRESSTASLIGCSDVRCGSFLQIGEKKCATSDFPSPLCGYNFQYGDGSGTSGYYVSDTVHFATIDGNEQVTNSTATVIFGCSNLQSGDLMKSDRAIDGIFGFGQQELSVVSQLSSQGMAPKVFSHCLKGSDDGGGILVLGEIMEPSIVYTPIVQLQPHYNINLTSIAVNGQPLPLDSSLFLTSSTQGTIIDSGTTLAYLAEQAYDPFVNAVTASVSSSVNTLVVKGNQCYVTSSSPEEAFPSVTLYFEGSASMALKPLDYLIQEGQIDNARIWCIGWQKNTGTGVTILGDLVLKDKIFVYDLLNQRIGWTDYDCSLAVNVSTSSTKTEFLDAGQLSLGGSSHRAHLKLLPTCIAVFLVHILLYAKQYLEHTQMAKLTYIGGSHSILH